MIALPLDLCGSAYPPYPPAIVVRTPLSMLLRVGLCLSAFAISVSAADSIPHYRKLQLSDQFLCEGSTFGDFNRDGKMDVVAGPYWYEGPDFKKRHEFYTAAPF